MARGWSGRERVRAALAHEQADRVPADLWAEPAVWARLERALGQTPGRSGRDQVCSALEVDVRYVEPLYPVEIVRDGVRENMWGERWREADTAMGREWHHVEGALAGAGSLEELARFPWPSCDEVDYSTLADQCEAAGDCAVFYGNADFFERPALVRGLERFLIDTIEHPEWVEFLQEKFVRFFVEDFHRAMEAARGKIDAFLALTDLGSQERILLSPDARALFVHPPLRVLAEAVHREGVRLLFHSCGAVREVVPELIECGVDILNPLQPAAKGMDPEGLKRDFGQELAFHGGIDIQYLLPLEEPEAVRREVQRRVGILGEGGGYILAPSHNLQADIPLENVLAMYEPALRA
jgi:uroporphyrinogen decarboxylase